MSSSLEENSVEIKKNTISSYHKNVRKEEKERKKAEDTDND